MRIAAVEPIRAGGWLFVRVTTDTGLDGIGEAGLWAFPSVAETMLAELGSYLIGKNPLRIEHHWQVAYRFSHFRGAAINGALAAVDIALWDIAGKYHEVPVCHLLGGPLREKVRLYIHISGKTAEALHDAARAAVEQGYTAVRFDPFKPDWPTETLEGMVAGVVDRVAAVRDAVRRQADICIECHYKLSYALASEVGRALAPYRILFLEDPLPPESVTVMGQLAASTLVPIATGERLHTIEEFADLLESGPIAYIRPDVCLTGITQGKKIAALAEARHRGVIPHNWLSPVNTAASVQLSAAIPNFVVLEYTGEDDSLKRQLVTQPLVRKGGYLHVPESPGLGITLNLDAVRGMRAESPPIEARTHADGSVVDM